MKAKPAGGSQTSDIFPHLQALLLPELFLFATFSVRNPRSRAWNLMRGSVDQICIFTHLHRACVQAVRACGISFYIPPRKRCGPARGAVYLLLGALWIVNVNMTYGKERERSLERLPEGAQWFQSADKASCCQGNGTEVIEFSQSSPESDVCIILSISSEPLWWRGWTQEDLLL